MLKEKQADMALLTTAGPLKDCKINRVTFSVSGLLPIKSIFQSNPVIHPFKTLYWLTPNYRIKAMLLKKQTSFIYWPQDNFPDSYSLPSPTFPAVYTQYIAFSELSIFIYDCLTCVGGNPCPPLLYPPRF